MPPVFFPTCCALPQRAPAAPASSRGTLYMPLAICSLCLIDENEGHLTLFVKADASNVNASKVFSSLQFLHQIMNSHLQSRCKCTPCGNSQLIRSSFKSQRAEPEWIVQHQDYCAGLHEAPVPLVLFTSVNLPELIAVPFVALKLTSC